MNLNLKLESKIARAYLELEPELQKIVQLRVPVAAVIKFMQINETLCITDKTVESERDLGLKFKIYLCVRGATLSFTRSLPPHCISLPTLIKY